MQELIDALIGRLNVDERQARGGAGAIFRAARDKLGPDAFDRFAAKLPGIGELADQAPAPGGAGRLFGGLAGALGGGRAALVAQVLASFGRLGLNQQDALAFARVMVDVLRERLDPADAAEIERLLRA